MPPEGFEEVINGIRAVSPVAFGVFVHIEVGS